MNLPIKLIKYKFLECANTCRFVNLFITSACTCRCKMCLFWRMKKSFIDMKTFEKAVDIFSSMGFYNWSLTGGEPLLHPDYFDFVTYLKKKGYNVNSPTNGTLLTEKTVKKMKDVGIDSVNVSIDSLNPEIADNVRNHKGQLKKALRGLELLEKYKIPRSTIIILAKHNIHEYCEMVKRFEEEFNTPSTLCFPDPGLGPLEEIWFTKQELVKVIDELLELKKQGYRLLNAKEYLLEVKRAYLGLDRRISCQAGNYMINVYWDGKVKPCFNKKPMGNVNDSTPINLINQNCEQCLNQCFIEFSFISKLMKEKRFFRVYTEWDNVFKQFFRNFIEA